MLSSFVLQAVTIIEGDMSRKKEEKAKKVIITSSPLKFLFFLCHCREKELAKVVVKKEDIELIVSISLNMWKYYTVAMILCL